ncbi:hypothetical protein GHYDROH2_03790 [Geobacter hydrogenophilus]|uniref:Peptidase M48 domain-containing protein n=1 Tax=Geobacter hydrogenophilus TaxID=40983 RepID=A0A9W6FY14_9BACT|nr:hypothetical protein GHYDROH2_03790 [Geobacter hydrogenophilus]
MRATDVFSRVAAAADKAAGRLPRLLVIREKGDPWAAAIPDGTIILSRGGLETCYKGVTPERGDARLAFVLGHELSHQSKDDFWHSRASQAVQEFAGSGKELAAVSSYIQSTSDLGAGVHAREVAKIKELQADGYGIVIMAMAGYDPHDVVSGDGTNFIQDFVSQITGKVAYEDPEHPTPAQRADFLRVNLASVAEELELFRIGVRYYQQGRYEDAVAFLGRFRERFPSREVFNDLGLSYFQLAMGHLSQCDASLPYRFKLPTLFDSETLAAATRGKGDLSQASRCFQDETYKTYIAEAVRNLELAQSRDSGYFPAPVNLAAAYIMAGEPTRAMAAAETALRIKPGDVNATSAKAVALYLFGRANAIDTVEASLALLGSYAEGPTPSADALYNMAAFEQERGRTAAMQSHLNAFLAVEKDGPFAAAAGRLLGKQVPVATAKAKSAPKSPIPLGDVQGTTPKLLHAMAKKEFTLGTVQVQVYAGKGVTALVKDDMVDLVEMVVEKPQTIDAFRKAYGTPLRELRTPAGAALVYDGFVADITGDMVRGIAFFPRGGI